jgi:phospholipase/lecithinase/hemolysin
LVLFFSAFLSAAPLNKVVVFGDSLSDNGNLYEYMKHQLPISPPYYEGRFTNGPVWVELLMDLCYSQHGSDHLSDFAFGGAGISYEEDEEDDALFTLNLEIDSYLLANQDKVDEKSLFIVWMGSNNYLAIPDGNPEQIVEDINESLVHSLQRLADKGAKHIMVINLPDLGKSPAARDFDAADVLSDLTTRHNIKLEQKLQDLQRSRPDVQWLFFDVNGLLMTLLDNPRAYDFTNVSDTCYEAMIEGPSSNTILRMAASVKPHVINYNACDGYLFFDPVHPTEPAHIIMATKIKKLLDDAGITWE